MCDKSSLSVALNLGTSLLHSFGVAIFLHCTIIVVIWEIKEGYLRY